MTSLDDDLAGAPTNPTPAQIIPVLDGMAPGRVLAGRYEIVARLGRGGMGAVFRAHDRELGEDVALKVILPECLNDPGALDRFRREVKIARKITHANVCRMFDMGEEGGLRFLTMELVEGRSLRELLANGPLEAPRALAILREIIEGVAAVHAQGIVHRDLKPDNILIRDDGRAVVADFGLARSPSSGQNTATALAGTPAFMSPEQLRGEPLDARSDIFSLGIVAYEMLTGRLPFGEGGRATIARAILRDPPRPLEVHRPSTDGERALHVHAHRAILRALAKEPADRFATVIDFGKALTAASEANEDGPPLPSNEAPEDRAPRAASASAKIPARAGLRTAIYLGAAASLGCCILLWKLWGAAPTDHAATSPIASASAVRGATLEGSLSKSQEAAALYTGAVQAMHDGDVESATSDMERAAFLDRDFGASRLRLAIWKLQENPAEARAHHEAATQLRGTLDKRDTALLYAMEPWLRQPPNFDEWEKRIEATLEAFPRDQEVLLLAARVRSLQLRIDDSIEAIHRALAIDPSNVIAWTIKADGLSLKGDTAGQLEAYRACINASPSAVKCRSETIRLQAQQGEERAKEALKRLGAPSSTKPKARAPRPSSSAGAVRLGKEVDTRR